MGKYGVEQSLVGRVAVPSSCPRSRRNFKDTGRRLGSQVRFRVLADLSFANGFGESYERGCQGKIFPPSSPRGDGCGDLHPAQSEIWRGFVFATWFSQTKAIDGVGSTVS